MSLVGSRKSKCENLLDLRENKMKELTQIDTEKHRVHREEINLINYFFNALVTVIPMSAGDCTT